MYVHKKTYVHMSILCLSVIYAHNSRSEVGMENLISVLMENSYHPGINLLAFRFVGNFTKRFPSVTQRNRWEGCYWGKK